MCNLLGYSKEEFNEVNINDIIFEEDRELNPPRVQSLQPGEEVRYERRLKRRNGTEVYVELTGGTMDNRQHLVFARDITEKRIAEHQKEFDRKNFNALINSTDDLMWSVDRNMDLITCNKAFEQLINQLTGKSLSQDSTIIKFEFNKEQLKRYEVYFERAFASWTKAEALVGTLLPIGNEIDRKVRSGASQQALDKELQQLSVLNTEVTKLEDDFSFALSEGARWLEGMVLKVLLALSLTIGIISILITVSVSNNVQRGIKAIVDGARLIGQGFLNARVKVYSRDEIGLLATALVAELNS
ncbi:MAG: PAS domain S-box protein, partial [Flavobacterium sp.]